MKCDKCNAAIPDSARFCPECGLSLADVEALRERCITDTNECEKSVSRGEGSRPFIRTNVFKRFTEGVILASLTSRSNCQMLDPLIVVDQLRCKHHHHHKAN